MGVSNKLEKLYKIKIFLKDELGQDEKWLEQSAKNPEESWKNLNQNSNNKLIEKAGILVANNPSHYANFDALWKDFNTFSDKLLDEYLGEKESKRILDELAKVILNKYFDNDERNPFWGNQKLYYSSWKDCYSKYNKYKKISSLCPNRIYSKYYINKFVNLYFPQKYKIVLAIYKKGKKERKFVRKEILRNKKFRLDIKYDFNNDIFAFAKAHGIKVP